MPPKISPTNDIWRVGAGDLRPANEQSPTDETNEKLKTMHELYKKGKMIPNRTNNNVRNFLGENQVHNDCQYTLRGISRVSDEMQKNKYRDL